MRVLYKKIEKVIIVDNFIDWEALRSAVSIEQSDNDVLPEHVEVDYVVNNETVQLCVDQSRNGYSDRKQLLAYIQALKANTIKVPEIADLYRKTCQSYLYIYENRVQRMLDEDIHELEKCFHAKAYKATLIMAGSILEAFLLDWLSEKDGVNYFTNPYRVRFVDPNGRVGWKRDENLKTYIDSIPELQVPEWMAENAHTIRKQRNLVHAKLCLRDDVGIDEETCKTVITYLKQVIESRVSHYV